MKPKYTVDGWGKQWWVMARNHKPVAQCTSKAMATKIATLLNVDASLKSYKAEQDAMVAARFKP